MTLQEKIKGQLKRNYGKVNLSKKRIDEISARLSKTLEEDANDEDIETSLENANMVYPFAEIAKEDDRKVSYENKINKLNKQISSKSDDDGEPQDSPKPTGGDNASQGVPEWAKGLTDTLQGLSTKMEAIEKGKVLDQKRETAKKSFSQSKAFKKANEKVKDHFFSQIDVDSETPIDEQISDLEGVYNDIVQDKVDASDQAGAPPSPSGENGKASKETVEQIANDIAK